MGDEQTMRKMAFLFAFLLFALPVKATDVYIGQSAIGSANGADCADAYAYTFFNNTSNWPSPIGPGTTVHICGTITATAGASGFLTFQGNGTSGDPITLKFETDAILQAPYWGANGAIHASGLSYIRVDGGTNGLLQATANGSTLTYQQSGVAIFFSNVSNSEIKNLTIANIYVHTSVTDENSPADGIWWYGGSNVVIDHNTVHDAHWCVDYGFPGSTTSSNVTMYSNTTYNCDHDFIIGSGNTNAILDGANLIYDNIGHDWANWDDNANNFHHDGIHVWAVHTGSQLNGLQIYNNYFYGLSSTGGHMTGHIYVEENPGTVSSAYVYNNVLINTSPTYTVDDGYIFDIGTNTNVFNNTIVSGSATNTGGNGILIYGTGTTMRNNIIANCYIGIYTDDGGVLGSSDYNDFYDVGTVGRVGTNWYSTLASWQSGTNQDADSTSGNPVLNASSNPPYQLSNNTSTAWGTGANLTSLGITPLDSDYKGTARPSSGAWDMGAYYDSGSGTGLSTTTALTSSATQVTQGTSVTFTATVAPSSGSGVPTGIVGLYSGSTTLGSSVLNSSGIATYSTSSLPVGTDSITSSYGGDSTYAASTSSPVNVTVNSAATPDFTISATPTSLTLSAGQSGTVTLTVTPENGFNQAVSLSCSAGAPVSCGGFSSSSVTPNGSAVTSTLTLTASATLSEAGERRFPEGKEPLHGLVVMSFLSGMAVAVKRRWAQPVARFITLAMLVIVSGLWVSSCGGNPRPVTSPTTVTVTGSTSGTNATSHAANVTVTVAH
jgi:hypothetical protein